MDFFAAQEHARRSSKRLLGLFAAAVCTIVLLVYFAAVFLTSGERGYVTLADGTRALAPIQWWQPDAFFWVTAIVGSCILLGSLYKIGELSRGGGALVATELGGRLVERASADAQEQRLLNIVDEMAIAAGIAVPPVYVLDNEAGINAFAAGAQANEAVVAVTRGALEHLSRDELQGVVGHEFSHILNGDMRLNIQLIGVLHGILLLTLAGRFLIEGGLRSRDKGIYLVFPGLVLLVLGSVGALCGRLIKAGVSREREYLADASAVQFTRNPGGLAAALERIAHVGSELRHPRAEEASHMLISTGFDYAALFATHPPLEQRIARLQSASRARAAATTVAAGTSAGSGSDSDTGTATARLSPQASAFTARIGQLDEAAVAASQALLASLPEDIVQSAHHPEQAAALLFALLLDRRDTAVRTQQLALLGKEYGPATQAEAERHARALWAAGTHQRLPLLDLTLPALDELAAAARTQVLAMADRLIEVDGRMSTSEYVLRRLLRAALLPGGADRARGTPSLSQLQADTARLLALLASTGQRRNAAAHKQAAFAAGAAVSPFADSLTMPDETRFGMRDLDATLARLAGCQPAFRKKIIDACAATVLHDGHVSVTEAELLRVVCRALDCPAPLPVRYASAPAAAGSTPEAG